MSKLGSALNSGQGIELGSMSNSTRNNAGVTTAVGTLIYNSDTEAVEAYGNDGWIKLKTLEAVTATGGTKSETQRLTTKIIHLLHQEPLQPMNSK